jgi:hypothetical protein
MLYRVNFLNGRIRIFLMIISIIIMVITHDLYVNLISHLLRARYNNWFEFILIAGMLIFQYLFLGKQTVTVKLNYYFRLLMISLIGSLLMWPLFLLNNIFACDDIVNVGYFFMVVIIMFFLHKKLVTQLHLPFLLSYSYIVFRFIFLLFLL